MRDFGIVHLGDRYAVMARDRKIDPDLAIWQALYTVAVLQEACDLVDSLRCNDKLALEVMKAKETGRPLRVTFSFVTKDDIDPPRPRKTKHAR